MPIYEYEHLENPCAAGLIFEVRQVIHDFPLNQCPHCKGAVKRLLQAAFIISKKSDAEIQDKGFTKLVRVDEGIFENVTRRCGEEKYVKRDDPKTFPHLHKTIKD